MMTKLMNTTKIVSALIIRKMGLQKWY